MDAVPMPIRFAVYVPFAYTLLRLYGGAYIPCGTAVMGTIITMIESQDPDKYPFQAEAMNLIGPGLAGLFPLVIGPQKTLEVASKLQRSPMFTATMTAALNLNDDSDERSRILKSILAHMIPQSGSTMSAIGNLLLDSIPTLFVYA